MSNLSVRLTIPAEINSEGVTIRMAGTHDAPLFCLADLCHALGIENPHNVAKRVDQDDRYQITVVDSAGKQQETWFVTEGGLYTVLIRSDKPQAKPFRKWVTGQVLPSIRRHGCYPPPAFAIEPGAWQKRIDATISDFECLLVVAHPGCWSVLGRLKDRIRKIEPLLLGAGMPLDECDLPDGSAGRIWSDYREGKPWAGPRYNDRDLMLPDGRRVQPYVYRPEESTAFDHWFTNVYLPVGFPRYIDRKILRDAKGWSAAGYTVPERAKVGQAVEVICHRLTVGTRQAVLPGGMRPKQLPPPQPERPDQRGLFGED